MKVRIDVLVLVVIVGLWAAGCSNDPTASGEYETLERELQAMTAERDVLAADAAGTSSRYQKSLTNQHAVFGMIADPYSFGTEDEALDQLMTFYTDDSVMDDTAFGPVSMRQAWSNTLFGTNSVIKTWASWLSEDGSNGGSLWTWTGTSVNGEPFELIGINIDTYDEDGLGTGVLVDWPYDHDYVRAAVGTGS